MSQSSEPIFTFCGSDPERSAGKIVLQVSVEAMPADTAWDRVYTEPVKIEAILDYIQALHTVPPETGEQEVKEEATCKITLHYSAGADKVYYMAGESYLREGEANWMRLEAHPEISLQGRPRPHEGPEHLQRSPHLPRRGRGPEPDLHRSHNPSVSADGCNLPRTSDPGPHGLRIFLCPA